MIVYKLTHEGRGSLVARGKKGFTRERRRWSRVREQVNKQKRAQ